MDTLLIATRNKNKVREIRGILKDVPFEIKSLDDLNVDIDVVEDGLTFEENACKKASEIMKLTGLPSLADDSGLEVYALGGDPGVHSARFSGIHGDDGRNNKKLLELMKDIPYEKRGARFVSAVVLIYPDGRKITARGEIEGYIAFEPRGEGGFGYDPIFIVPEYDKSFAELGENIKNKISHRGRALEALRENLAMVF